MRKVVKTKILKIIEKNKYSLISILQEIQKEYKYLSFDNMYFLSEELKISLEEVYGVITFYNEFNLNPVGKYEIKICLGTVCYVKGASEIVEEIHKLLKIKNKECTKDGKFSLNTSRCLGCCSLAPVIKINEDVYPHVKRQDLKEILEKYK